MKNESDQISYTHTKICISLLLKSCKVKSNLYIKLTIKIDNVALV